MEIENCSSTNLLDLPNEILIKIFNYLPVREVFYSVALVCRRIMAVADESLSNISIQYSNDKCEEEVKIYFINSMKYKKPLLNECQPILSPLARRITFAHIKNVNPMGPYAILNEIKGFNNLVFLSILDSSKKIENSNLLMNFVYNHKNIIDLELSFHVFDVDHIEQIINNFKSLKELHLHLILRDLDSWIAYETSKSTLFYKAILINEKILKSFKNIRDLKIESFYNSDNDKDLQVVFKNMINLIAFEFLPPHSASLTDYGITGIDSHGRKTGHSISKFINLEKLCLNQCPNLTDMSLLEFRFPKLRILEVNCSKKFSERAIRYIVKHCVDLTDLILNVNFKQIPLFDEATLRRVTVEYDNYVY